MGLEEVSVCKINQAINQAKLHNFYILTDVIYIKKVPTFWHLYFNIMANNPLAQTKVPNFFLCYKGFKQDTPCSWEAEPHTLRFPSASFQFSCSPTHLGTRGMQLGHVRNKAGRLKREPSTKITLGLQGKTMIPKRSRETPIQNPFLKWDGIRTVLNSNSVHTALFNYFRWSSEDITLLKFKNNKVILLISS